MGKKYIIDETTLTDIADAVRDTFGDSTIRCTPEDMAGNIGEVYELGFGDGYSEGEMNGYDLGFDEGNDEGYDDGYEDGYNYGFSDGDTAGFGSGYQTGYGQGRAEGQDVGYTSGYEAGKQAEWSNYWNAFTNNGSRENYKFAFYGANMKGVTIDSNLCKPVKTTQMFYNSPMTELPQGINFSKRDTTAASTSWSGDVGYEFGWCNKLLYVYDIGIQPSASFWAMFANCSALKTIEIIRVKEETILTSTFDNCRALENITFEGVIGRNISFASSPLTVESMISVITHLKDYSEDATNKGKYTLTLKDTCKTLMAEQGAIAELGGKTYDQYITDIGWNLA